MCLKQRIVWVSRRRRHKVFLVELLYTSTNVHICHVMEQLAAHNMCLKSIMCSNKRLVHNKKQMHTVHNFFLIKCLNFSWKLKEFWVLVKVRTQVSHRSLWKVQEESTFCTSERGRQVFKTSHSWKVHRMYTDTVNTTLQKNRYFTTFLSVHCTSSITNIFIQLISIYLLYNTYLQRTMHANLTRNVFGCATLFHTAQHHSSSLFCKQYTGKNVQNTILLGLSKCCSFSSSSSSVGEEARYVRMQY